MDLEFIIIRMEMFIKDNLKMVIVVVKVFIIIRVRISMKENGGMIKKMVMES